MVRPASSTSAGAGRRERTGRQGPKRWRRSSAARRVRQRLRASYRSPLKFADGSPVKNADDWAKRRQEILKTWHEIMGPWPTLIEKPKIEYLEKERRDGLTQHHVRLEVAPGRTTDDAYLLVPDGKGPFPAVLVVFYEAKTGIGQGKRSCCDFALQLAKRGFVTLSLGSRPGHVLPGQGEGPAAAALVPRLRGGQLLQRPGATCRRWIRSAIGIVGHSYGGKWAMFASCLYDKFACGVWSDPGIVFDENAANVNYWEPWYLGYEPGQDAQAGHPDRGRTRAPGPYKRMIETGHDLHELHALMAPRPFLVSGGSEDPPERWKALNHAVAVNRAARLQEPRRHDQPQGPHADGGVERAALPVLRARPETRKGGTGGLSRPCRAR